MAIESGAHLPGVLAAAELHRLLEATPPLLEPLDDLAEQLQPHGIDVRLESVWQPAAAGRLGRQERLIPDRRQVAWDAGGWLRLPPGGYVVRLVESVALPLDVMALGFPRSSLLRVGCSLLSAVWDAGYHGRSEALLLVTNPHGFEVQRGARIAQLVFFRLAVRTDGYHGTYQGENL